MVTAGRSRLGWRRRERRRRSGAVAAGAVAAVVVAAGAGSGRRRGWCCLGGGRCRGTGGGSGVLWTAATGALAGAGAGPGVADAWLGCRRGGGGAGGASAAGKEALAVAVPGGGGGGGGGTVPLPNSPGDALGEDGSASGAAASACCVLVRSAISALAILASAARSGSVGFGGTDARFGYGWSAPGGGGLSSAILPPCRSCHQLTGFIAEGNDEQPDSSRARAAGSGRCETETQARRARFRAPIGLNPVSRAPRLPADSR